MPSRIDKAGHTKAFNYPVAEHWGESQRTKRSLVGFEPTSAHTYESEIQRSTTYATPTPGREGERERGGEGESDREGGATDRERGREKERDRQTETERDRQTDREVLHHDMSRSIKVPWL